MNNILLILNLYYVYVCVYVANYIWYDYILLVEDPVLVQLNNTCIHA